MIHSILRELITEMYVSDPVTFCNKYISFFLLSLYRSDERADEVSLQPSGLGLTGRAREYCRVGLIQGFFQLEKEKD